MDTSQSDNQASPEQSAEEHETHTTALVFLIIVTILISFVALQGGEGVSPFGGGDDDDSIPAIEEDPASHGSLIPQEDVEVADASDIDGLPSGLYIDEERIQRNQTASGGQQIVRFSTGRSATELFDSYEAWMEDAGYTINQRIRDEYGAKLAARSPDGEQLTISITSPDEQSDSVSVMIDFVAAQ